MNLIRKGQTTFVYLAVLSYVLCTLVAYARFPGSISPSRNWLSDLGDITQNPDGAVFYNLGILLTGLGTAFGFSVSALRYLPNCPKWILVLGGVTALVDILSGVYHESKILEWVTVSLFIAYLLTLSGKSGVIQGKLE